MKSIMKRVFRQRKLKGILLALLVCGIAFTIAFTGIVGGKADGTLFSVIPMGENSLPGRSGTQTICYPSWYYVNYSISTVRVEKETSFNKPLIRTHNGTSHVASASKCNVSPQYEETALYSIEYPHNVLDHILYLILDIPPPFPVSA